MKGQKMITFGIPLLVLKILFFIGLLTWMSGLYKWGRIEWDGKRKKIVIKIPEIVHIISWILIVIGALSAVLFLLSPVFGQ